ncbi:4-hydroxy-tetrahydrodipicolinate synthase [Fulvivirgaceae bacterium BMA12]|uniref:4-hydroxy-tetrahydrodipicolinate synthase n=1 Tax=Agaribacillus aureus TaxID=3051825 RepID=A0ABT8L4F6_9BACT|nr:4-hydroxy-tetrahydrodipicolinate synthase [Fulvivirgaceae bacterium BMA12]
MSSLFSGTGVALVTPFDDSFQVDYRGLDKLLEYNAENGVDYFVVLGTTGESPTTSLEEKKEILKHIKNNNPRKLPIMYGIGGNHTLGVIDQIKGTEFDGVDGLLSVSPYYNKPSQAGIINHYEMIADASPVPVILYNVPGRTASNLTAGTTLTLAQHPNIVGIKEASGDINQCLEIVRNKPDDFLLISGDDMLTVPLIGIGAVGVISVMANAFPALFKKMTHGALEGDTTLYSNAIYQLSRMNALMYKESNPTGVKQVLQALNICGATVRPPLLSASEQLTHEIKQVLETMDWQ